MTALSPIRLGISRCLLGDPVRYDGGHKRNHYLADILSGHVEWVPVCPEVEAGLGTPREPMQLVGPPKHPKLLTVTTGQDKTAVLKRLAAHRVQELKSLNLSGYIFKARSPSCGVEDTSLHDRQGRVTAQGAGLFVRCFHRRFPLTPITDEGRLADPMFRRHFLERVFGYHRWQTLVRSPVTRESIARFHQAETALLQESRHKYFLVLDRLVSRADRYRPRDLATRYGKLFLEALSATPYREKQSHKLRSQRTNSLKRAAKS